jgi:hypothetical protein
MPSRTQRIALKRTRGFKDSSPARVVHGGSGVCSWLANGIHVTALAHRDELVVVETDSGRTIARSIKQPDGNPILVVGASSVRRGQRLYAVAQQTDLWLEETAWHTIGSQGGQCWRKE